ncbi:UNVERIFIED_CONTAM: Respiratory burst oxidaseprotein A [Sesamum radiatum]|uniref:Respiratory burst oxidaseprotein A n=1 Tax=Sesamum radiatum TaxID=300843 RepID=A0AAW2L3J3_SESRA
MSFYTDSSRKLKNRNHIFWLLDGVSARYRPEIRPAEDRRRTEYSGTSATNTAEEFVEVTLDLQDDDTIILRSVEPATVINIDGNDVISGITGVETPAPASASTSRSTTMRRSTSNKLLQFSQELKAEHLRKRSSSRRS